MDNNGYFSSLSSGFNDAFEVAKKARLRGIDPRNSVEIIPAADLAGRVQGLIGVVGVADLIRRNQKDKSRNALAFAVVKEICTSDGYSKYEKIKRIELAARVGTAIITEAVSHYLNGIGVGSELREFAEYAVCIKLPCDFRCYVP